MSTLQVRYVGLKPKETDCVASTGVTWTGYGDIQTVPAKAWAIMQKHTDVWELVLDAPTTNQVIVLADVAVLAEPAGLADAGVTNKEPSDIAEMNVSQLRALAAASNRKIDGRLKTADAIRAHLLGA